MTKQERITKAIITASYDDDGKDGSIEDKARKQLEREIEKGYTFPSPVILRDTKKHRVTKFNFLVAGIPMIAFPMMNTSKTNLERIAVVGDEVTKALVEAFSDFFKDNRFKYGYEGEPDEWKFSRTLEEGRRILAPDESELVMVLMGDTPLKWNFKGVLDDSDIQDSYDVIYNLNSRIRTNRHWPRQYHFKVSDKGIHLFVKEAQLFLANLSRLEDVSENLGLSESLVDMIYDSRKTHGSKGGKSRKEKLEELFFNDGRWWPTLKGLRPYYALQLWYYKSRNKTPLLKPRNAYRAIQNTTGLKILFKADNYDPGTLEDIDGLADWAFITDMLLRAENSIYPYYSELRKFGDAVTPELRRRFDFYAGFEEYMNSLFREYDLREYDLPEPYADGKTFQNPFTLKGDPGARKAERIIIKSIKRHERYNRIH